MTPESRRGTGGPGDGRRTPAALPDDLQAFADEIALVQQRIQRLDVTGDQAAELSRELRRAVETGRRDVGRGRSRLGRLTARLPPAQTSPE